MNVLRNLYNQLDGWSLVANKGNITVERKFLKAGSFVNKDDADKGGKHACVKSSAIINGKPEDIFNLFLDIHRIHEYNEHVSSVKDVHYFKTNRKFIVLESNDRNSSAYTSEKKSDFALGLNSDTDSSKMSYATGYRMGPFKARDFLSIVNFVKFPDNSYVILNRPAYFSKLQPNKKYVRATILLAGNIIEPYGDNKSLLTLIAHVNPGGGADTSAGAWIINKLCALGPPKFIKAVEKALNQLISNFTLNELNQALSNISQLIEIKQATDPETPVRKSKQAQKLSIVSKPRSPLENEDKKLSRSKGIYLFSTVEALKQLNKGAYEDYTLMLNNCMNNLSSWVNHDHVISFYIGRPSCDGSGNIWNGMMSRFNGKYKEKKHKHLICLNIGQGVEGN
eukprot:gene22398-29002_t